uniref:NACHT, LRR and PYD domains-containing protein 1-like n=1 Tax=Phallusia mammillata TaxID=59560 RepID=A0A6F9DME7_9ASCI|nr:NACHT, LRR and PYD domains-containing protein 1-like [Phallusia mammillata]
MDLLGYCDVILELLSDIIELTLLNCNVPITFVEKLGDFVAQHKINLSFLNVSGIDLNGVGQLMDTCIHTIPVLQLAGCNLNDDDFTSWSRAIRERNTNMDLLNLSYNVLSQNALENLAPSVHQLDGWLLHRCSISGDGLKQLCHEILKRQKPMNVFSLKNNNIGLIGVSEVSTCVHNIRQLWLDNCNLTGTCLKPFLLAILKLDHQMETFSIGGNKVGSEIIPMLAKCVHKSKRLDLDNCGMNADEVKIVTNETKFQDEPMTFLALSKNKFGDEGAIALTGCLNKVEVLDLRNCDITSVGAKALWEANLKWKREIWGLDSEFEEASETSASSDEMAPVVTNLKKKRCQIS